MVQLEFCLDPNALLNTRICPCTDLLLSQPRRCLGCLRRHSCRHLPRPGVSTELMVIFVPRSRTTRIVSLKSKSHSPSESQRRSASHTCRSARALRPFCGRNADTNSERDVRQRVVLLLGLSASSAPGSACRSHSKFPVKVPSTVSKN